MRTSGPYEEYGASRPWGPTELTASAPGYAAGNETPRPPLFPAAHTTTQPRERAYATASAIAAERAPPPRERLSTRAPWSAAQRIASAIATEVPLPTRSAGRRT